jgi:hypothetical protein
MKTANWIKKLNDNPIDWLLDSNPWTRYRTLVDILEYDNNSKEVKDAHANLIKDKNIQHLINETAEWMPKAATRNNDPQITYFKLRMLAEFGLTKDDPEIDTIYKKAVKHIQNDLFACKGQIPVKPKKGEVFEKHDLDADVWHISPCNSPVISYALYGLGYRTDLVNKSIDKLKSLWDSEIGWFCHFFFVEGQHKKLKVGCPIAGMMALDVFSLIPELKESKHVKNAFSPIQFHKEFGETLYYFGRSKKFWTFKYPFVWYNGLYLADVLSRFVFLKKSLVLQECIDWIIQNQDKNGRFKPTSIFMPYRNWDFGNKKEASPWITFLTCRILKRYFG